MELLTDLTNLFHARAVQYGGADVSLATRIEGSDRTFIRGTVRFTREKSTSRGVTFEYPNLLLERKSTDPRSAFAIVSEAVAREVSFPGLVSKLGPLSLQLASWEYHSAEGLPNAIGEPRFSPFPSRSFVLAPSGAAAYLDPRGPIATPNLPLISNSSSTIDEFISAPVSQWPGQNRGLIVILPDFRARFSKVRIRERSFEILIEPGLIPSGGLSHRVALDGVELHKGVELQAAGRKLLVQAREQVALLEAFLFDRSANQLVDWIRVPVKEQIRVPEVEAVLEEVPESTDVPRSSGASLPRDQPRPLVFISHAHEDVGVANEIADFLPGIGLGGFVAHRDITPTSEWKDEIRAALDKCVALVAIVTHEYLESDWTEQETGWALGRKIPVLPIGLGAMPRGFLGEIQTIPWNLGDGASETRQRLSALARGALRNRLFSPVDLVRTLAESRSSYAVDAVVPILVEQGSLSRDQALVLAESIQKSYTLQKCWSAKAPFQTLLKPHVNAIPSQRVRDLRALGFL